MNVCTSVLVEESEGVLYNVEICVIFVKEVNGPHCKKVQVEIMGVRSCLTNVWSEGHDMIYLTKLCIHVPHEFLNSYLNCLL